MSHLIPQVRAPYRKGLTLLELLVVIAVLLLVTVTAIPVLTPSDVQKVRDAAITVNSMISRVKTAAARDNVRGAGLWLQPLPDGSGAVIDMFTARTQDPYVGDDPEAARVFVYTPAGGGVSFPDGLSVTVEFAPPPGVSLDSWQNTRLLFFPDSPSNKSCGSVSQLCAESSRASIRGGEKHEFKLIPSGLLPSAHMPQPYRAYDFPCAKFFAENVIPVLNSLPFHPDTSLHSDKDFDYRNASWTYPTVPLANECSFVGILQPVQPSAEEAPSQNQNRFFGYTVGQNTPLEDADATFSIDRPNTRAPTPPLSLPSGYAIDMRWSGWAHTLFTPSFGLNDGAPVMGGFVPIDGLDPTQPFQLIFDSSGNLSEVIYRRNAVIYGQRSLVDSYFTNLGDVYLLVGRADRCGSPYEADISDPDVTGANWQYPDSRWIRISKTGGTITISEPYPGARTLIDSLKFAIAGIAAGRG